jgi:hypothetical protein
MKDFIHFFPISFILSMNDFSFVSLTDFELLFKILILVFEFEIAKIKYRSYIIYSYWPGNTKGGMYHCTVDLLFDWFRISCMTSDNFCFCLQNRLIRTSQTGGQRYSDTSHLVFPAKGRSITVPLTSCLYCFPV